MATRTLRPAVNGVRAPRRRAGSTPAGRAEAAEPSAGVPAAEQPPQMHSMGTPRPQDAQAEAQPAGAADGEESPAWSTWDTMQC